MFKSIVVATDGSDHANNAVSAASALAQRFDAKLTICHVKLEGPVPEGLSQMLQAEHMVEPGLAQPTQTPDISGNLAAARRELSNEQLHQVAAEQVVTLAKRTAKSLEVHDVDARIDDGDPVDAILDCATRTDADLIVMGRRGLSDLKGLVLGSVSHKVAARAECACLTVK